MLISKRFFQTDCVLADSRVPQKRVQLEIILCE